MNQYVTSSELVFKFSKCFSQIENNTSYSCRSIHKTANRLNLSYAVLGIYYDLICVNRLSVPNFLQNYQNKLRHILVIWRQILCKLYNMLYPARRLYYALWCSCYQKLGHCGMSHQHRLIDTFCAQLLIYSQT